MKISQSVRNRYDEIHGDYCKLRTHVDARIGAIKSKRWHYESRIKDLESYALKLETGREKNPGKPEDMFGCTIVVENHSRIDEAARELGNLFKEAYRRPANSKRTSLSPHSFSFEDLRLYMRVIDDEALPPTGLDSLVFEIQIKTFLQHAWGIATHDLVYKSDEISWATSRVAFQVKAMLENAELSISEAKRLTASTMLDRCSEETIKTSEIIAEIKTRWSDPVSLPKDLIRLADNILHLGRALRLDISAVWKALDAATSNGRGAKVLNLSPYGAILESLLQAHGASLFAPLAHPKNSQYVFVPLEVELPGLHANIERWIIKPTM